MTGKVAEEVAPLILSWNEQDNLGRTLRALGWARHVVVLDSGSTDATETIAREHENVHWHVRAFDCHAEQWRHGIDLAGRHARYVLALDADMVVHPDLVSEIERTFLRGDYAGGAFAFRYVIEGTALLGSVYPSQVRLFQPARIGVAQVGHTQQFSLSGPCYAFHSRIDHDDRKSLRRWLSSQLAYVELEAERIRHGERIRFRDRLRQSGLAVPIVGLYAYLRAGGVFRGRAALRYGLERAAFEAMLALRLLRGE